MLRRSSRIAASHSKYRTTPAKPLSSRRIRVPQPQPEQRLLPSPPPSPYVMDSPRASPIASPVAVDLPQEPVAEPVAVALPQEPVAEPVAVALPQEPVAEAVAEAAPLPDLVEIIVVNCLAEPVAMVVDAPAPPVRQEQPAAAPSPLPVDPITITVVNCCESFRTVVDLNRHTLRKLCQEAHKLCGARGRLRESEYALRCNAAMMKNYDMVYFDMDGDTPVGRLNVKENDVITIMRIRR